jgi:hypothetical protein
MRFLNIHAIALIGAYASYRAWYFATVSCRRVPGSQAHRDHAGCALNTSRHALAAVVQGV